MVESNGPDESAFGEVIPDEVASSSERLTPDAVRTLYETHATEMLAFLQGVLRDADRAREALQNTFQKVMEAGHTARAESIRGWLFRVAFHEAMALRRKQAGRERTLKRFVSSVPPAIVQELPDVKLIRAEDVAQLKAALTELPPEQRHVVERRIYAEETFAEIAEQLRLPIGTVLTRMRLALQKLQKALGRPPSKDFP